MAGITLEQAEAHLTLWLDLAAKLAENPHAQYVNQGRSYTNADLGEVRANIEFWDKQCKRLNRGGPRVRGVMPL